MSVVVSPPRIEFDLQPKQNELHSLLEVPGVVNIGYGGPRGGGKSRGIRDCCLIRRLKHPGTTGWIVRRTFGELWENHIKKYFKERPYLREFYNSRTSAITLPKDWGGGDIVFRYAEHEGDLEREYGKEAMDIFVDQGEQFTEDEHNFLRTCRRSPGVPDGLCKKIDTINPGGKAHGYMKRIFLDRQFVDNEIPSSFAFVRAAGWDNVEWSIGALAQDGLTAVDYYSWSDDQRFQYFISRSEYGRTLNALPEKDRIPQLLGSWDFFEGQVFPELSGIHNIDDYFDTSDDVQWEDFHRGMKTIGSLDHASTGITTYGITGIDVDENQFQLEEYYKANELISEHASAIKNLKMRYNTPEYEVIDPSTESKTLQESRNDTGPARLYSVQDAYRRLGLNFISAHRSSISVGIDLMKELLKVNKLHRNPFTQEMGSPRLFISRRRCPNLWKEMTHLQIIDGKYVGVDHGIDRIRYVAMSRPSAAAVKPKDVSKLEPIDQLKLKSEEAFKKQWSQQINGSGSWY